MVLYSSFLLLYNIPVYGYTTIVYNNGWIFELFPAFGYNDYDSCPYLLVGTSTHFSWGLTGEWNSWVTGYKYL